ncbi:MAG: aspartate kinase [Polyangiaceae bacterium]|nr:aspartate kinase [Polyangiaceae bacterium]
MALVVQKFGGTSMGSIERIKNAAARTIAAHAEGNRVVVIVSAMSGETDRLLKLARDVTSVPDAREMDALAATGEQVASALMAIAIHAQGHRARSYLGHQMRILTDSAFTKARIKAIDASRVVETLAGGEIVVVAGFQGVDEAGNITTLGRGGSDTSAVAIAAALGADVCEIFTDVDGVYTTDPNICPTARKIDRISYEEMLELASLGAKVLQIRSVEMAMKYGVPVHVRSSFSSSPGTLVTHEGDLEQVVVTGIAYDKGEARVMLVGVRDQPGVVAEIFTALAAHNVSVDMIIQNVSVDATALASAGGQGPHTDVTFTVAKNDLARVRDAIAEVGRKVGAGDVRYDEDIVKVSVVGLGMRSHAGVAAKMFRILAEHGINIQAISTSEIKVSCLVATKYTELAVRALHEGFELGGDQAATSK